MRQACDIPMHDGGPGPALIQFRIDFERAVAKLPQIVRDTGLALFSFSAVDAGRVFGCSRQMISRRKLLIREAMLAAGIGSDYFAGEGTQS
jgi:hypothetical protein